MPDKVTYRIESPVTLVVEETVTFGDSAWAYIPDGLGGGEWVFLPTVVLESPITLVLEKNVKFIETNV